ncbi:protein Shroom4 isoform X1 [Zootoca vivipara]|uniref:protein Shroom4 isoform X1 n=3 Tax=Zootoca vivipara TaxID=8524 RepID=UPI00293B920E|nr:protein Shroom4 isoform X1 [Zootoca vivipara]
MARPSGDAQRQEPEQPPLPLVSYQHVPVHLAGGAPWGFTLEGGLEHGKPLVVSKVEDGGKASLSQNMCPGDELVNINGTPLYGSRQEALILIKGSYRTLKMIIRRRIVPLIRPHSWHLAKVSEVRTEADTNMHFPTDAFSLSWHSGCDPSDLPLPWNPLARHCSTDKISSLGSMESLDQGGQTYYEGSLSPIDQTMYHNKRDSAYSSFSASSNASDSALRSEDGGVPEGLSPDPRYLQTSGEAVAVVGLHALPSRPAPSARTAPCPQDSHFPSSPRAVVSAPPQPPVRQDSLRACNPPPTNTDGHRKDSPHLKARWTSDTLLSVRGRDPELGKESPTEHYYLLSSHADQPTPMEKEAQRASSLPGEESSGEHPLGSQDPFMTKPGSPEGACPPHWKACWAGALSHRHSAPEHLLAAQLQALNVSCPQEGSHWTVSPLHMEQRSTPGAQQSQDSPRKAQRPQAHSTSSRCHMRPERPRSVELASSPLLQPTGDASTGLKEAPSMEVSAEAGQEGEGSTVGTRKGGSSQHRSAHMRRRSDRFATNLRNEIQWRKAQLQKAKGSALLLEEGESSQEAGEPPGSPPAPPSLPHSPPPPLPKGQPPGLTQPRVLLPRRWGSELSVLAADGGLPSRSKWKVPLPEQEKSQGAPPPGGSRGGRWRWSPEHKLQLHRQSQQVVDSGSPLPPPEDSGLLPFADRRKFFEETSRPLSSGGFGCQNNRPVGVPLPRMVGQDSFQPASSEHRDQRRHSVDQPYRLLQPPPPHTYQDFLPEGPAFCKPLAQCGGDCDHWRPIPCPRAARETCCYGDRCSASHHRNMPAAPGHWAHHCHSHAWNRCSDCCCCPAQHKFSEEGRPWHARKTFLADFSMGEWEPPAPSRKTMSPSMSELAQHKVGFARLSPFWTCSEASEAESHPPCLTWDSKRPGRAAENPDHKEDPASPHRHPLRERAYSESHLCAEQAGASGRERQEAPLAKLEEETRLDSPRAAKQKGPPPPRPPPPNWEKYRPRRASHSHLLPPKAGPHPHLEEARTYSQSSSEVARQRSQSLPLEQLWGEASQQLSPRPQEVPHSPYHYDSSPRRTPEWAVPDGSSQSGSSRPACSLEEAATPPWQKGKDGSASRTPESVSASPSSLASKELEGVEGDACHPGMVGPVPPFRLNSEELMRDVAGRDRSLAGVLSPTLGLVTAAEVMGDFFSPGEGALWQGHDWPPQAGAVGLSARQTSQPVSPTCVGSASPNSSGSAYYNLSAGKAELLNKMKELPEGAGASSEEEEVDHDLARKKVQLIESISRKLGVLQEAQRGLHDDMNANMVLGREVESHVKGVCKPHEYEKFRLFIGDLEKVVNLLLSLSGRLARVENALSSLDLDATAEEEKLALLEKKRQLMGQLEDAKELQEHVSRRERLVFASVSRCLPAEQLQDYHHFVRMKSALAIQQRQLEDKIKLGEEQLRCLRESLRRGPREY